MITLFTQVSGELGPGQIKLARISQRSTALVIWDLLSNDSRKDCNEVGA